MLNEITSSQSCLITLMWFTPATSRVSAVFTFLPSTYWVPVFTQYLFL